MIDSAKAVRSALQNAASVAGPLMAREEANAEFGDSKTVAPAADGNPAI